MIDLILEQGEDIVRNNERIVKCLPCEVPMLCIKEFPNEVNKEEKIIRLNKMEAKKIYDEIRLIRFTPKPESKLPFSVKGIIFENEEQIKKLTLALSKFIGNMDEIEKINIIRIIDHKEDPSIVDYQVIKEKENEIKLFLNQYVEPTEFFTKSIEEEIIKIVIGNLIYNISREIWKKIKPELIKILQNNRKIPEN